jgi:hypothetical protein
VDHVRVKIGDYVRHPGQAEWGLGRVLDVISPDKARVRFLQGGERLLSLPHAPLEKMMPSDDEAAALAAPTRRKAERRTVEAEEGGRDLVQREFFQKLGAPLRNIRWSWGAARKDGTVVLRVWKDQVRTFDGEKGTFARATGFQETSEAGARERQKHIDSIRDGEGALLVMCEAADVEARPRKLAGFNARALFRGGRVIEREGFSWLEVGEAVPFEDAVAEAQRLQDAP